MDKLRSSSIMQNGYGNAYKKVFKDKRLTQTAKLIHAYLCSYAGMGDTAFPPASLICDDLGMKTDTYYENLMCLKAYGYITTEQLHDSGGKFSNTVYTIELYPELREDKTIEAQWLEMIEKRKARRKKWEEKHRTTSERGTDENDRTPSERDSVRTDSVRRDTNIISSNNHLFIIWDNMREAIKEEVNISVYTEYIETLQPVLSEEGIVLVAPSDWHKGIIESRYLDIINNYFKRVCKENNFKEVDITLRV